jgi:hypothetical protein
MNKKAKQGIFAAAMKDPKLLSNLAQAMTAPLMQRRDYSSVARRAFSITYPCGVCKKEYEEETQAVKIDYINQTLRLIPEHILENDTTHVCVTCLGACVLGVSETFKAPLRDMPKLIHNKNPMIKEIALHRMKEAE